MDSTYEEERRANIAENERLLQELGLAGGSSTVLGVPQPKRPPAPRRSEGARKRVARDPPPPHRVSARLLGVKTEAQGSPTPAPATPTAAVEPPPLRVRHGTLDTDVLVGDMEEEEKKRLRVAVAIDRGNAPSPPPPPPQSDFTALLQNMQLRSHARVAQKRIYSMLFHPTLHKDLVFVGDQTGAVGVWDALAPSSAADDALPEGASFPLQLFARSAVGCMRMDPTSDDHVYASSYDGSIRRLSLSALRSDEVWDGGDEEVQLSEFAFLAPQLHAGAATPTPRPQLDERSMWAADHRGGLLHLDVRAKGASARRWQVSDKKVGSIALNSAAPHCVATASNDRSIRLFDVRMLRAVPTCSAPAKGDVVDMDAVDALHAHAGLSAYERRMACTSVDFSPRGDYLAGVSYDDTISLWELHPAWLHKEEHLPMGAETHVEAHSAAGTDEHGEGGTPAGAGVQGHDAPSVARRAEDGGRRGRRGSDPDGRGADDARGGKRRASSRKTAARDTASRSCPTDNHAVPNALTRWLRTRETSSATPAPAPDKIPRAPPPPPSRPRPADVLRDPRIISHNNQTGRWVTLFRATWNTNTGLEPHFAIGSMSRHIELYAKDGRRLASLYDAEWVTAVPAVIAMHPVAPARLASGNGSGRCALWASPAPG
ncbi:hypothetical protein MSPP1_003909 [Malassezia sp. CBS 17886]|nr:hypothetical protein MSPP1_003909 [Malassezia sp. CBS 17886]